MILTRLTLAASAALMIGTLTDARAGQGHVPGSSSDAASAPAAQVRPATVHPSEGARIVRVSAAVRDDEGDESDAKALAQKILDEGAALFSKLDATAMANTYVQDAQVTLLSKDQSTGGFKPDVRTGRTAIESLYRELYKDRTDPVQAKNTVLGARMLAPGVLVIEGTFQPDLGDSGSFPFLQIRTKHGERWLIQSLTLFYIP